MSAVEFINNERVFNSEKFYLDYLHNFLTLEAIASYYNVTESQAKMLIDSGREVNHQRKGLTTTRDLIMNLLNK